MNDVNQIADVSILHGPRGGLQRISLFAVDGSSEAATGPDKAAQRFTLEFLTPLGSMPFSPNRGSTFPIAAASGVIRVDLDVRQEFSLALGGVLRNLAADERPGDSADERVADVSLTRAVVSPDGLILEVAITTAAGVATMVALPIVVNPFARDAS